MSSKHILTIDLGTTGTRVIAFDQEGHIVTSAYQELTMSYPQPEWVEQDPRQIIDLTRQQLKEVGTSVGVDSIAAISITNQRETTIVWDRQTGDSLHPALVWQDKRTRDFCRELEHHSDEVRQLTGLPIDPYFSASKLRWLVDTLHLNPADTCFGTPESWLLWHLTSGNKHVTEISNASRTLLLDINTGTYSQKLSEIFGIDSRMLPEVMASDATFGQLNQEILGVEIPLVGCLGDQQASLYGQTDFAEGLVKNTYGTGLFVMQALGPTRKTIDGLLTTIAGQIEGEIHYALEGSIFIGGSLIQWLRDQLHFFTSATESETLAASVSTTDGLYLVPAFVGLGAPYWQPQAKGVLVGITRGTTQAHIARAALEALAFQTRDVLDIMRQHLTVPSLRVDGGATHNKLLMQMVADICQVPVEVAPLSETTAWGSALLAGRTIGLYTKDTIISNVPSATYQPQLRADEADRMYAGWLEAVTRAF